MRTRHFPLLILVLSLRACATGQASNRPSSRSNVITAEELVDWVIYREPCAGPPGPSPAMPVYR